MQSAYDIKADLSAVLLTIQGYFACMCISAAFSRFVLLVSHDSTTHVLCCCPCLSHLHLSAKTQWAIAQHVHPSTTSIVHASTLQTLRVLVCRKFDFFPKGTAGADGWMSLYFKFADQFSDNQQIGFGFKLHVINFQFPSQTLTKGMWMKLLDSCCACSIAFWGLCCAGCATMLSSPAQFWHA